MANGTDVEVGDLSESKVCVWCYKEIRSTDAALELGKGAHAHLACDSRMLNFIESLEGYCD